VLLLLLSHLLPLSSAVVTSCVAIYGINANSAVDASAALDIDAIPAFHASSATREINTVSAVG
jgi:hypothetical protein